MVGPIDYSELIRTGAEALKSPFLKGGFRGIMRRLFNPPCPPLEKGGKNWEPKTEDQALQRLAREVGHLGEPLGVEDRQVGQDLAVQVDLGLFQPADEFAVGHAQGPQRGVDADDPQGAELPFPDFAVPVGEGKGPFHGLPGGPVEPAPAAAESLGHPQKFFAARPGGNAFLDAWHNELLSQR